MRYALLALLSLALPAQAAETWWTETTETLPTLVAQGYEIVGFAMFTGSSGMMGGDMTYSRYVLQKGASVYQCSDNAIATPMGAKSKLYCLALKAE